MQQLINLLKSVNPNIDYENERGLISDGVIDSLSFVMIFTAIAEKYGIDIPLEEMKSENFDSADAMLKLIEMNHKGQ